MLVSTRTPSFFFQGGKLCLIVFEKISFSRPSSYFLWPNDFDNQQHFVLKYFVIDSFPLMGRYFCKQISPFWLDNRGVHCAESQRG